LQNSKLVVINIFSKTSFAKNSNQNTFVLYSGPPTAKYRSDDRPPSQNLEMLFMPLKFKNKPQNKSFATE